MVDAIYIHVPFCKSLCSYCDFLSFSNTSDGDRRKYVDYLIKEIGMYTNKNKEMAFDTIYFGGGTPSLLNPEDLKRVLDELVIKDGCEITIEVNPKSVDLEKLKRFREIGINRLSIGLQSFNDKMLKILGRGHNSSEGIQCYLDAREAGFDNISLDLMFSLPGQTIEQLDDDLQKLFELNPEHFSIYSLIWEEGTPFYEQLQKGILKETDNELEADMFNLIIEKSKKRLYNHYEISNFSKENMESKHNSKYWKNSQYLGIGLGASGYVGNERYKNFSTFEEYYESIDSVERPIDLDEVEIVDLDLKEAYRNMLGLRLLQEGVTPSEKFFEKFKELEQKGLLKKVKDKYVLTKDGLFFANDVFQELI